MLIIMLIVDYRQSVIIADNSKNENLKKVDAFRKNE